MSWISRQRLDEATARAEQYVSETFRLRSELGTLRHVVEVFLSEKPLPEGFIEALHAYKLNPSPNAHAQLEIVIAKARL